MAAQPMGTVTLLFSDMEAQRGCSNNWAPSAMQRRWSCTKRLLRGAFGAHGGYEFGTEGDAFFVAFARAEDAVAAAAAGQQALAAVWPEDAELRVRRSQR